MPGFSDSYRKSNHLHLIISSEGQLTLSEILRDFKRHDILVNLLLTASRRIHPVESRKE